MDTSLTRISRSAIDTRLQCEMKRWYQYHFRGTGLQKRSPFSAANIGTGVHNVLSSVLKRQSELNEAVAKEIASLKAAAEGHKLPSLHYFKEQEALIGGLSHAWLAFRCEHILDEYDVQSSEEEFEVEIWPGFIQQFRMDVILRRKDSGKLTILDFKTATGINDSWIAQWDHDIQTFLYLEGLKKFSGEEVDGIIYEGLIKGQRKVDSAQASRFVGAEIQYSPFCYGYKHRKGLMPIQTEWPGSYSAWEKVGAWEHSTWQEWNVDVVEPDVMYDQLATTGLISPAPELRQRYLDNIFKGEERFRNKVGLLRCYTPNTLVEGENHYMERNPKQCLKYGTRYQCEFYDLCYSSEVREDPIGSGLFTARVDHHEVKKEEE